MRYIVSFLSSYQGGADYSIFDRETMTARRVRTRDRQILPFAGELPPAGEIEAIHAHWRDEHERYLKWCAKNGIEPETNPYSVRGA